VADVGDLGSSMLAIHRGPFSSLARSQYRALASMRWSMFRNGLRSSKGALELGARTVMYVFYVLMGVGLAAGLGGGAYAIATTEKWEFLPAVFWVVFVLWQAVPVSLASFQEQYDLGGLLRFPVAFGSFYLLHLIFGLIDVSTILGAFCCSGIWVGLTIARPDISAWAALSLVVFSLFNILLVRAIFAWLDRWLAKRRTREVIGALFFVLILAVQFVNPAFHAQDSEPMSASSRAASMRWLSNANALQQWLPPGLASSALQRASRQQPAGAVSSLALLGIYLLGTGGALALRLRAGYRGENLSDAPSRKKAERRTGPWLIDGSGPIAAVMEKELRILMRALPLIYGLAAPLLMVFVFSGLFRGTGRSSSLGMMIGMGYAMVGFTQLFYNNLGPEGPAVQVLFLSPTPIRTVILAKNLFHGALFLVDAVLVCILATLRLGPPSFWVLSATVAWLLFALPVHLAAGNAFSLAMPYRINLGRISRQRGSQASALLSMLIQIGVLGVGTGIAALCSFFDRLWLATPVFLVMAAGAVYAWVKVMRNVDAMANKRREALIATLVKTD
jgi:ABC-2 type transport system permease protein